MNAPRWILEALDVAWSEGRAFSDIAARLTKEMFERLPIAEMTRGVRDEIDGIAGLSGDWSAAIAGLAVSKAVQVLAADHDVVTIAELYQDAARALDAAGVPYGADGHALMDMPARIRWLAQQHPTRSELARVEAERDQVARELEQCRHDLDAEQRMRREAEAARDGAVEASRMFGEQTAATAATIEQTHDENDQLREEAREALQQCERAKHARFEAERDRDELRETLKDRNAQIEALELEIDALEDEIWWPDGAP